MIRLPLTPERIVSAALKIADSDGLDSLSMRRVGEALGVEAMSLYNHVANKEGLLDGLIDAVFAQIEWPPADLPWRAALRVRALSAHEALRRHPWATPLMSSRSRPGPATLGHHNAVLGCLRTGGFALAEAAHAVSVVDGYLYGFALQERALPFHSEAEAVAVAQALMAHFPRERYPFLAEIMTDHAMKPGYDFGQEFEFGLDLILDGLERMLT